MRYAIGLTALMGCASVSEPPDFSTPGIFIEQNGDDVRVIAPDYEFDFAATGVHLPEHLKVNQGLTELLGTDAPCYENRAGFSVSPALSVAAGMSGFAVRSEITPLLAGPAVAKVEVTFAVDYGCPGLETVSGKTDFTLFPGGRIVREDVMVTPSTHRLGKSGNCGCQQEFDPMNFHNLFFTSFWAFDPGNASQVQADGSPVTEDVYAACTMYPDRAVGVAWAMVPGTATRFQPHIAASHILDWVSDQMALDPAPQSITSAIQVSNAQPAGPADCGKVLARLADVPLQIGKTRLDATDHDGIYRDLTPHPDAFTITAPDAAVPPGFAISVDLGGADHAVVSRSPAADPIAIAQREIEGSSRFLFVFLDGLAPGDTLMIEPRR
jgi:hypothetical protein